MSRLRIIYLLTATFINSSVSAIETGPSDFRITEVGPALDTAFLAVSPAIVHNATSNEFLLVWSGDGDPALAALDDEIYVQRLNDTNGQSIGLPTRISQMGPDVATQQIRNRSPRSSFFEALDPAVAWNNLSNEYLVVWWGDDNTPPLVDDEREIFGRRLAADGSPLAPQFRISFMGADGDVLAQGLSPDVVYNPLENEYFVTFGGDNINGVFANQEFEIWGQRITANTGELAGAVIRISDMGSLDGDASFTAADSRIAFNPASNEYLVTWEGDDDGGTAVDGEVEIYGQRIDASNGLELGVNDFRISFLGPEGDTGYDSTNPTTIFNSATDEYLVAWNGSHDEVGSVENDIEVFSQRISITGGLLGSANRISAMGPGGLSIYWGLSPAVAVRPSTGEYLVVWRGEDNHGELVNNEFEIYGQLLTPEGQLRGRRYRLSHMGPDGTSQWGVGLPALAGLTDQDGFLLVWDGQDDRPGLAPGEVEIFGQFLDADILFTSGFE